MTWLGERPLVVLCFGVFVAGCAETHEHAVTSEPAPAFPQGHDAASEPPSRADAGVMVGGGAPLRALGLRLSASPEVLCPGQCSVLRAVADGRPPYTWRWDHELPSEAGPHQVCPIATTTYAVEVEDTPSSLVEFPEPAAHASASVRVTVRADCDDASAPSPADAGIDVLTPVGPASACTLRIPLALPAGDQPFLWGIAGGDNAGNLVLAAQLTGSAQLGPDARFTTPTGVPRIFVAKYDARCALVWARWIDEADQRSQLGSMEVHAQGQIALSRSYEHSVAGAPAAVHSEVVTLSSSGDKQWALDSAGGALSHAAQMHGLAWGHDGALAVFGLPELCAKRQGSGACVAKVSAEGRLLFARLLGGALGAGVALDAAGALYAAGLSGSDGIVVEGATLPTETPPVAYAAKFGANGATLWFSTSSVDAAQLIYPSQGFVSASAAGVLVAWDDALSPARGAGPVSLRTRAWRLTAAGANRSLDALEIIGTHGKSATVYTGTPGDELLSAEYFMQDPSAVAGDTPGTTQLAWHEPGGARVRAIDLEETAFGAPSSVRLSPAGAPILVTTEQTSSPVPGSQTALVLRRLAPP